MLGNLAELRKRPHCRGDLALSPQSRALGSIYELPNQTVSEPVSRSRIIGRADLTDRRAVKLQPPVKIRQNGAPCQALHKSESRRAPGAGTGLLGATLARQPFQYHKPPRRPKTRRTPAQRKTNRLRWKMRVTRSRPGAAPEPGGHLPRPPPTNRQSRRGHWRAPAVECHHRTCSRAAREPRRASRRHRRRRADAR